MSSYLTAQPFDPRHRRRRMTVLTAVEPKSLTYWPKRVVKPHCKHWHLFHNNWWKSESWIWWLEVTFHGMSKWATQSEGCKERERVIKKIAERMTQPVSNSGSKSMGVNDNKTKERQTTKTFRSVGVFSETKQQSDTRFKAFLFAFLILLLHWSKSVDSSTKTFHSVRTKQRRGREVKTEREKQLANAFDHHSSFKRWLANCSSLEQCKRNANCYAFYRFEFLSSPIPAFAFGAWNVELLSGSVA